MLVKEYKVSVMQAEKMLEIYRTTWILQLMVGIIFLRRVDLKCFHDKHTHTQKSHIYSALIYGLLFCFSEKVDSLVKYLRKNLYQTKCFFTYKDYLEPLVCKFAL